jgi:hypothetical protein
MIMTDRKILVHKKSPFLDKEDFLSLIIGIHNDQHVSTHLRVDHANIFAEEPLTYR